MPSSFTPLGVEKMVTGEKSGQWGSLTNANWNLIEQISGGYLSQALNTTGATALAVADGTVGDTNQVGHRILNLTAALAGNVTVTIPLDVQTFYVIKNSTTNSYTVEFKYVTGSGSSVTWAADDKSTKLIYATANDGTNPDIVDAGSALSLTSPALVTGINDVAGNELVKVTATGSAVNEFTIANAASGSGPTLSATGGGTDVDINITPKAAGKISLDGIKWPNADGSANQILTTNASGVLSFVDNSGGIDWQAVEAGTTMTAVAGEGYFINTTSNVCTATLPAGTIGDEVAFIDYAGTFDSYALTVAANGSEKIHASTSDLTVSVERAGFTLVFTDTTQGWLLKDK